MVVKNVEPKLESGVFPMFLPLLVALKSGRALLIKYIYQTVTSLEGPLTSLFVPVLS